MTKMQTAPYIPESAPFSPEQRAWLNGFLAGLFSSPPAAASHLEAKPASLRFGVYFASQTGTAERLAKKMAKELKTQGHLVELASLEKVTPSDFAKQQNVLLFASTYGEGEPPDSARNFRDALFSDPALKLSSLRYAVFCLGDTHYEHFCKFGAELDDRLAATGATRLVPRTESDVDVDEPFAVWKGDVLAALTRQQSVTPGHPSRSSATPAVAGTREAEHVHTREKPYWAPLCDRRALTSGVSSKLTVHLGFALGDSALHYQAGDACGVIAQNHPSLVDELMARLPFSCDSTVDLPKHGNTSVRNALLHHLQPTRLSRKIVQHFAEKTNSKHLQALLAPEAATQLDTYMYDRDLLDLLEEFPGTLTDAAELVHVLPRLAPRLYSISSSPAAHGRELHCTVAVVRYRSHNRERHGIASTMLAERVAIGEQLPIYIQPNKRFRLPSDSSVPMIMIGPGTGIAPFRAFLHERQALGHMGRNWLFFGERSAQTDFLYCQELQSMCDSGHLTRLHTAFSRDQAHKVYVQDRMVEQGAEMWRWLNEGAQIFVCGDASRMAKDVDAALHTLVEKHGSMDAEAAKDYVSAMHENGRYHRDVY